MGCWLRSFFFHFLNKDPFCLDTTWLLLLCVFSHLPFIYSFIYLFIFISDWSETPAYSCAERPNRSFCAMTSGSRRGMLCFICVLCCILFNSHLCMHVGSKHRYLIWVTWKRRCKEPVTNLDKGQTKKRRKERKEHLSCKCRLNLSSFHRALQCLQ